MFYLKYNIRNKKRGFTIVELTVSLSIIIILLSLVMANYNAELISSSLSESQSSLYHHARLVQGYALSNKSYNDIAPNYWGLYFNVNSSTVIMFADLNDNFIPDSGEFDPFLGGRTISLSGDVVINYISYEASAVSVLFEIGSGAMNIYDVDLEDFSNIPYHIEIRDRNFDFARLLIFNPPFIADTQSCSCSDNNSFCCSFCQSTINCIDMESN